MMELKTGAIGIKRRNGSIVRKRGACDVIKTRKSKKRVLLGKIK
jgi:hypothetical protein